MNNDDYTALEPSMFRGFTLFTVHQKGVEGKLFADPSTFFDFKLVDDDLVYETREGSVRAGYLERYYSRNANAVAYVFDAVRYVVSPKEIKALYKQEVEEIEKVDGKKLHRERKAEILQRITDAAYAKAKEDNLVERHLIPVILTNNMLAIFSRNKITIELCVGYLREQKFSNGHEVIGLDDNSRFFSMYEFDYNQDLHAVTSELFRNAAISGQLGIINKRFRTLCILDVIGLGGTENGSLTRVSATHIEQGLLRQVASDTVIDKIKLCPIYWVDDGTQRSDFNVHADLSVRGVGTLRVEQYVGSSGEKGIFIDETERDTGVKVQHEIDVIEAITMLLNAVYFSNTTK